MSGNLTDRPDYTRRTAAVAACLAFASSSLALAQNPGQWWWTATVGLGERSYENSVDGSEVNDFDQQELDLSFDLNGFIVHPAIASFRLSADLLLAEADGRKTFDSDRAGLGADLKLLPYGAVPMRLYARRSLYDYSRPDATDPFTLAGAPDSSTRWGGQMRIARGALAGVDVGFESETTAFLRSDVDDEQFDRQYLNWSRANGDFRHRLRLERRDRDYGTVDLELDDITALVDERAKLSPSWEWELRGSSLRRDLTDASGEESRTDVLRVRNRFLHSVRQRDFLDFRIHVGATDFDGGGGTDTRSVSAYYRWRPRPAWELAPFASYSDQSSGDLEVRSPRAGASVTWRRGEEGLDVVLGSQVSYGRIDRSGFANSGDESQFAAAVTGSLAHGDASGLRKEFDFELSHDELRLTRDLVLQLPDLGLPRDEVGTQDFYRARLTLGHRWDGTYIDGWGEWNRQEADENGAVEDFAAETISGTVQFGGQRYSVHTSFGRTEVRRGMSDDQDVAFLGTTGWVRPWRYLGLRASWRTDDRNFDITEDVEADRYEVGAELRFGTLRLDLYAYENSERLSGGIERENRGFNWTVSTRFAGTLPIVTGTRRRGVIR